VRFVFKETSFFTRQITEFLADDELNALQWALMADPEKGDLIHGSGGLRKLRWAGSGRGKRGGLRVIYYWHVPGSPILYLTSPTRKTNRTTFLRPNSNSSNPSSKPNSHE
jgi:mRNA-degrading endonuclease RelE of RelBE toxin-antitoxin system